MAAKWVGGLAAVGLALGLGVTQLWSEEPEGCPEDGCRVGYRFEDGGKDPEGWEPYQTDDPVVALMDACLTYFMTGSLEGTQAEVVGSWTGQTRFAVAGKEETAQLMNYPMTAYGTFKCNAIMEASEETFVRFMRFAAARFEDDPSWTLVRSFGARIYDESWLLVYESSELEAVVRLRMETSHRYSRLPQLGFDVNANYHGPYWEFRTRHEIVF